MAKRSWKNRRATGLRQALEMCLSYASEIHNLSVERVAELMGLHNYWILYKWISKASMPAHQIRNFENVCQCTFVTDYIAASAYKLIIDIPAGRKATSASVAELNVHLAKATEHLIRFYEDPSHEMAYQALDSIKTAMEDLAWHNTNVEKTHQPELEL